MTAPDAPTPAAKPRKRAARGNAATVLDDGSIQMRVMGVTASTAGFAQVTLSEQIPQDEPLDPTQPISMANPIRPASSMNLVLTDKEAAKYGYGKVVSVTIG